MKLPSIVKRNKPIIGIEFTIVESLHHNYLPTTELESSHRKDQRGIKVHTIPQERRCQAISLLSLITPRSRAAAHNNNTCGARAPKSDLNPLARDSCSGIHHHICRSHRGDIMHLPIRAPHRTAPRSDRKRG